MGYSKGIGNKEYENPEYVRKRITWALNLAQADLKSWRDDEWVDAMTEMSRFVRPSIYWLKYPSCQVGRDGQLDNKTAKEWLVFLQADFLKIFKRLIIHTKNQANPFGFNELIAFSFEGKVTYHLTDGMIWPSMVPQKGGNDTQKKKTAFKTGMIIQLMMYLSRIQMTQIKACPACDRYFLASGKQAFDTPQCSTRKRVARFLAKQRDK